MSNLAKLAEKHLKLRNDIFALISETRLSRDISTDNWERRQLDKHLKKLEFILNEKGE